MILIADSGSTKTHWVLMGEGCERHCTTEGLNPLFADAAVFGREVSAMGRELQLERVRVSQLFFYGSGCGTESACGQVREWLGRTVRADSVEVSGDLLGACRATCGHSAGLVGILGTGSNMCYYDGCKIARRRVSTGYILGDEGSGNHIGKRLLKDYLEERMPEQVRDLFYADYPCTTAQFIDHVYRRPNPNRYLASLASFADRHRREPYVQQVLQQCFSAYFDQLPYFGEQAQLPLSLVGGLVSSFSEELKAAATAQGVTLGAMVQSPIAGLMQFHGRGASDGVFFAAQ